MGIDIYLEWDGMTEEDRHKQISAWSRTERGNAGYLRESYHGEPYATQILVREAFEAEDCRAKIPAAVMRERMDNVTEPAYGKTGGHELAKALGAVLAKIAENDPEVTYAGVCRGSGQTTPMTVREAITERAKLLYGANDEEVAQMIETFEAFIALAEKKEQEHGKPCTVYASY
jgi:hypothetical protein